MFFDFLNDKHDKESKFLKKFDCKKLRYLKLCSSGLIIYLKFFLYN